MKALFFFFLSLVSMELTCDKYNCTTFSNPNQCASTVLQSPSTIGLRMCSHPLVCQLNLNSSDFCTANYTNNLKYPGEYCEHNFECFSDYCANSTCRGKQINDACKDSADCEAGLYCKHDQCYHTVSQGKCISSESCGAFFVCSNKACTRIGSLDNGEQATVAAACKSYYIHGGRCSEGPKLLRKDTGIEPTNCQDRCVYSLGAHTRITEPCKCGMTVEGKKFCNPGRGDIDLDSYWKYVEQEYIRNVSHHVQCGIFCRTRKDMGRGFSKAYVAFHRMVHWNAYQDNPECVKHMINENYWNAIKDIEAHNEEGILGYLLYGMIVLLGIVSVILLIIMTYIKKRQSEENFGDESKRARMTSAQGE